MVEDFTPIDLVFKGKNVEFGQEIGIPAHSRSSPTGISNGTPCKDDDGNPSTIGTIILIQKLNNLPITAVRCVNCLFTIT